MVLPIAENFPIQFPTGTGGTQGSVDIAVSSTQGFAYVAGLSPTNGDTNLQNFVINVETGEFFVSGTLSSQPEGAVPSDQPEAIAVFDDGQAATPDKVYVVGSTRGDILSSDELIVNGGNGAGPNDIFILEYTPDGTNLGTPRAIQIAGEGSDLGLDVTVDGDGDIYVVGKTNTAGGAGRFDAFVAKFTPDQFQDIGADATGLTLADAVWSQQFGSTENDEAVDVVVRSGTVYVTGNTDGNINADGTDNGADDESDYWVATLNAADGTTLDVQEQDTDSNESVSGLAVSGGNLYVVGDTNGDLGGTGNAGGKDSFVARFDNPADLANATVNTVQFGSGDDDLAAGIDAITLDDEQGNPVTSVFATGTTEGRINGDLNAGSIDSWVAEFEGNLANFDVAEDTQLAGTDGADLVGGIDIDSTGNYYITGETSGQFDPDEADAADIDNFAFRFGDTEIDATQGGEDPEEDVKTQSVSNNFSDKIDESTNFDTTQLNDGLDVIQNDSFSFTVDYSATDDTNPPSPVTELNGIGLRVHFNSENLTFDSLQINQELLDLGFDSFVETNVITAVEDTDNFDNDPTTDSFVPIAFFGGGFPGVEETDLFDINFTTDVEFSSGESNIRFSASATHPGYEFGSNVEERDITLTPNRYTYDVDGDGEVSALSDGLQIYNAISKLQTNGSFQEEDVIGSAISPDGTREFDGQGDDNVEADDIFNWLQVGFNSNPSNDTETAFDIDGNGETDFLTDGTLLLRSLFGFEGAALTTGAVDEVNGTRTTAEAINGYIDNYFPVDDAAAV